MDLFNQVAISIKVDLGIFYSVTDNLIESFFTLFPVLQPWLLGAPSGLLSLVAQPPCFLAPYGFPGILLPFLLAWLIVRYSAWVLWAFEGKVTPSV